MARKDNNFQLVVNDMVKTEQETHDDALERIQKMLKQKGLIGDRKISATFSDVSEGWEVGVMPTISLKDYMLSLSRMPHDLLYKLYSILPEEMENIVMADALITVLMNLSMSMKTYMRNLDFSEQPQKVEFFKKLTAIVEEFTEEQSDSIVKMEVKQ